MTKTDDAVHTETSSVAAGHGDRFVAWFSDLTRGDVERVGGKGANLGELTRAGIPVPSGFVVTAAAYLAALDAAGVRHAAQRVVGLDVDDLAALARVAAELQGLVWPPACPTGCAGRSSTPTTNWVRTSLVAVRSSATAEDTASTSFAGMNETFTNVSGDDDLVDYIGECWASLWSPRVVAYRARDIGDEPAIAVVVQRMVDSEISGVMFTADPATRPDPPEPPPSGWARSWWAARSSPDTYVLSKEGPRSCTSTSGPRPRRSCGATTGAHRQRCPRTTRHAGCSTRAPSRASPAWGSRSSAALRQAAGHRVRRRGPPHLDRPVPAHHDAVRRRARPRPDARRHGAGDRLRPRRPGSAQGLVRILRSPKATASPPARSWLRR